MFRRMLIVATAAAMAGCATPPPRLDTPSGNPEVTIQGVARKQVVDKIVDTLTARGMTMQKIDEYNVVAGKRAENDFSSQVLFGSRYDSVPEYRVSFTLIERPPAVKVYARVAIVTNPGSAFERPTDMTDQQRGNLQDMLVRLQSSLPAGN